MTISIIVHASTSSPINSGSFSPMQREPVGARKSIVGAELRIRQASHRAPMIAA
jgi:hypothetical protein